MSGLDLQLLLDANNRCGEAPLWDPVRQRLLWSDIPADTVYALKGQEPRKPAIVSRDVNVSGIALNADNSLILAGAGGLHLLRSDGTRRTLLTHHEREPLIFNDILAAPGGRLYAGTVYWGAEMDKPGKLYLIEPPVSVRVVDDNILLANGLALSLDRRTLYFADSAARCIYAYDVDRRTGSLSRRRTLATFAVEEGIPDGLTTDIEGFIYCAMWYGSQVLRLDPEGTIERRIPAPAVQTSSVALGGTDLTDLYITSAGEPWPSPLAPPSFDAAAGRMGGALYRLKVDVPGRAELITAFA